MIPMVKVRLAERWCGYKKGEIVQVEVRLGRFLCEECTATPHGDEAARVIDPELPEPPKKYAVRFVERHSLYHPGEVAGFERDKFLEIVKSGAAVPLDAEGEAEVEVVTAAETTALPAVDTPEGQARLAAVRAVVELLGPDDHELWEDGKPALEALRTLTSIADLTAEERDAVWAEFAPPQAAPSGQ